MAAFLVWGTNRTVSRYVFPEKIPHFSNSFASIGNAILYLFY